MCRRTENVHHTASYHKQVHRTSTLKLIKSFLPPLHSHVDRLRNCFSEIILFQIVTSGVLNCGIAFTLAFVR